MAQANGHASTPKVVDASKSQVFVFQFFKGIGDLVARSAAVPCFDVLKKEER